MAIRKNINGNVLRWLTFAFLVLSIIGTYTWTGLGLLADQEKDCNAHADSAASLAVTIHELNPNSHKAMREAIKKNAESLDTLRAIRKDLAKKWFEDKQQDLRDSMREQKHFEQLLRAIQEEKGDTHGSP